jgi:hypothetical protein
MWLVALYVPGMAPTTKRFVAPLWFAPSIILMQGFVIFGPCYQVFKNRRLESDTRQIIAAWEHKKKYGSTFSDSSTKVGSSRSRKSVASQNAELYTLGSLEKALQLNPKPLLLFAALKDFSGENISFLTHISEWKSNWTVPSPSKANFLKKVEINRQIDDKLRRQQFNVGVHIYASFVSLKYSDFPINISSPHLKELDTVFAESAAKINKSAADDAATNFMDFGAPPTDVENYPLSKSSILVTSTVAGALGDCPERTHYSQVESLRLGMPERLPADISVPSKFGPGTFDHAEASILELVLTNTWPKYVNAGYATSRERT